MFGHLYYFCGLLLFLLNLAFLMNFFKIQKTKSWIDSFFKVTKRKPNENEIRVDDYNKVNSLKQIFVVDFFWLFFGLVTSSWKFFSLILIFNFIMNFASKQTWKLKLVSIWIEYLKLWVITFSIGATVINHFHLHLDLYSKLIESLNF